LKTVPNTRDGKSRAKKIQRGGEKATKVVQKKMKSCPESWTGSIIAE